jgi:DNA-binding transcriptional regulator YdaS (Cro superfamily)
MGKGTKDPGLQTAIKAAGTGKELARRLGVSPALVSLWPRIPAERVVDVEQATGVPRHLLRPDLHLPPSYQAAE